jgi:hypothetical protein
MHLFHQFLAAGKLLKLQGFVLTNSGSNPPFGGAFQPPGAARSLAGDTMKSMAG